MDDSGESAMLTDSEVQMGMLTVEQVEGQVSQPQPWLGACD